MNLIEIENKAGKVKLTDAVTPWSVEKLTEDIGKLFGATAAENGADFGPAMAAGTPIDTLEIQINSPGGSIFDGYNIYNEIMSLRERGVVVTATVTGMAASMASVICMACNVIRMVPHGKMMIHEASQGVRGNAEELRKAADLLDGLSEDIAGIYAQKTSLSKADCRAMMKEETWMNSEQAMQLRFIDEIKSYTNEKNSLANNANNVHLPNNDMSFLQKLLAPSNEEITSQLEVYKTDVSNLEANLAEFQSQIQTAELALQEAATEISNLRTKESDYVSQIDILTQASKSLSEELSAEKEKTTEDAIEAIITARIAGSGHPPIQGMSSFTTPEAKPSVTRAEFREMNPFNRANFLKTGGKLAE